MSLRRKKEKMRWENYLIKKKRNKSEECLEGAKSRGKTKWKE